MHDRWRLRAVSIVLLIALIVSSQFRFFNPVRDVLRSGIGNPVSWLNTVSTRVGGAFHVLFTVNDLSKQNLELSQESSQLKAQIAALESVKAENDNLRKDLSFKQNHGEMKLLPVQVIGYSPTNLYQSLTIDRGADDGLSENMAVVSGGYLVGKVHKTSNKTAEVWLLTNRNILTPVSLTATQTVGLLTGGIRGLIVENIPVDTKVTVGENVITSSLEGLYPAGIAVGKVAEIISLKEDIFVTLRISSPISISNLSTVFVVVK